MGNEPHQSAPPAEPISTWQAEIRGDTTPPPRRWRWLLAALGVLALVAAAVVVTVLVMRPDEPAKPNGMTQDLAVAHVQDEFPGEFTKPDKLIALFKTSCGVLDAGGNRTAAILPMIEGGLTAEQASYILDISIYSTCPQYATP